MTEPLREPPPPRSFEQPVHVGPELARKNMLLGFALFGVALLIVAGTIVVALVYLALD